MPRTQFLADVEITIFRQAPELPDTEGNRPSLASRKVGEDYAHRRDVRNSEGELGGLQTYTTERQYVVRVDESYTIPRDQDFESLGEDGLSVDALGEEPVDETPVARDGSNARAGMLLRDEETREMFDIVGVRLVADNKRLVIRCASRRGNA